MVDIDTNNKPLVSVIMNCFNSAEYLREAIESVIKQTYTNWELIFWDNQSTDESAAIFKSYKDVRFKYYYAPKHTTLGEARKYAFEKAEGKWSGILDCDDIWLPMKLEMQIVKGTVNELCGIVYSDYNIIGSNGVIKKAGKHLRRKYEGNVFEPIFKEDFTVCWPTVLFNMQAFKKIGSFIGFKYLEDFDILLRFAEEYQFEYVDQKLASYRVHDKQSSVNYHMMLVEKIEIINKWQDKWIECNAFTKERKKMVSSSKAKAYSIAGKNALYYGNSGIKFYADSLKISFSLLAFMGFFFSLFGPRLATKAISLVRKLAGRSEYY
jgi:glycosyltransferase involved in cell wall biosynthesis